MRIGNKEEDFRLSYDQDIETGHHLGIFELYQFAWRKFSVIKASLIFLFS